MKKVLFVATVVKTHIMEFHIPYLKMLKEMGWETAVAARNDYENPKDCVIPYCDTYYDIPFARNPLKPENIKAFSALKKVIDEGKYDIIHCHTPVGAMLTRLAALEARKKGTKVIYTAHGFHFYSGAPLLNWLVYYPVEKWLAKYTDVLITINKEDYERAKCKFKAKRIEYVPGVGINIRKFNRDDNSQVIRKKIRSEFGIAEDKTLLLSVGELNTNKNHRVVIEALPKLDKCYYVICGRGPLTEEYKTLATQLGVRDRLIMTGYRTDVADFYKAADIFVFPSFREGLPVSVMEAMASGLPIACTKIRGSADLVKEGKNGFYFLPRDAETLKSAVTAIQLSKEKLAKANRACADSFDIEIITNAVRKIYCELVDGIV